jgi:hypothetical protein
MFTSIAVWLVLFPGTPNSPFPFSSKGLKYLAIINGPTVFVAIVFINPWKKQISSALSLDFCDRYWHWSTSGTRHSEENKNTTQKTK